MKMWKWVAGAVASLFVSIFLIATNTPVSALTAGDFSLQVSPSPLVTTLKPGQTSELELKIRNSGTTTEKLKIDPRSFTLSSENGSVTLNDTAPTEVAPWVSFSEQNFSVEPGTVFTQRVRIALPKDSGFSYSFALVISRQSAPQPAEGGRLIKASIAVFTLINVDRPGATRKLETVELEADKKVYEYLPSKLSVAFKNTGNTIVQPYGNIFIQRSSTDATPLGTLPVNENKGYILPGSTRILSTSWTSGFPLIRTDADGNSSEVWDWSHVSDFRFGKYTAKLVGVYNDGQRDVPLESEITFWVIPWKILLGLLVVLILVGAGIWSLNPKIFMVFRRLKNKTVHDRLGLQR